MRLKIHVTKFWHISLENPILKHFNPFHFITYFCKLHFSIVCLCFGLPNSLLPVGFSFKIVYKVYFICCFLEQFRWDFCCAKV